MLAFLSDAETVTLAVVGFFLVLVLLTFARLLLRKAPPSYRRFRVGVFVERDDYSTAIEDDSEEQTAERPERDS